MLISSGTPGGAPGDVDPGGPPGDDAFDDSPRVVSSRRSRADLAFRGGMRAAAITTLVLMAAIGLFLLARALPALRAVGWSFFTETQWVPQAGRIGIGAALPGTFIIGAVALVIAVPLALSCALFVSEYAPPRLRSGLVSLIDLMAAIPSIVYGLWGFFFLTPKEITLSRWLTDWMSWFPPFRTDAPTFTASSLIAGTVVAMMVIPIVASISREVFSQAPQSEREAAYALGATQWGMIRTVVLPFGRGGVIGAVLLGLGRALGETIAVLLIISLLFDGPGRLIHLLQTGGINISALIATRYGEDASGFALAALMAAGLTLFAVTLVVNALGAVVISRTRSGASTEA